MEFLTKQEELFLLTIFSIRDGAYLVNIREHLIEHADKDWAFGSIYMTLEKLRKKGYVTTRVGEPASVKGGKAIKYYDLTQEGIDALMKAKRVQDSMWKDFSDFATGEGPS